MNSNTHLYAGLNARLNQAGSYLGLMRLRLLLAWEFWESRVEKFNGDNWFARYSGRLPLPVAAHRFQTLDLSGIASGDD